MSDECWDDEYVTQPVKMAGDSDCFGSSDKTSSRGRGRGHPRGRVSRGVASNFNECSRGRGQSRQDVGRSNQDRSERGRGTSRGRSSVRVDSQKSNEKSNDDNFSRGRGRGRNLRVNQRKGEPTDGDDDNNNEDSVETNNGKDSRRSRCSTPPRGVRGRTRSSCGRMTSDTPDKKEDTHARGRGRGRGRASNAISRSDGEESDKSDDGRTSSVKRGRGRGRGGLERSKSFRGTSSYSGGRAGGWSRGRGGHRPRGSGGKVEEEKKPSKYIPPEPTDDEDIMFHSGITSGIHFNKYDYIGVEVTGENVPKPISTFETAGLKSILLENVRKSGYTKPTPIQKNALPIVSAERDLMACAQTGSGKTAAFLIPVINSLLDWSGNLKSGNCAEPAAVVLSPTRELAIQIFQEARKFAFGSQLQIALVYGGTSVPNQLKHIQKGCHILVAVPGRLLSFVESGNIKFSQVKFFILDEADRMLELGFKETVKKILSHESMTLLGERRTMMFSATFPQEIQELAATYLHNYLFLAVGVVGGACADVDQLFHEVADKFDKRDKLFEILKESKKDNELTLVFVGLKRRADFLACYLCDNNIPTTSIHGDRYQFQREEALSDFKSGKRPVLIATAVAARGLDIKNVSHVINCDLPNTIEEYVHRIGRTGRVGNCGKSTSFYDPNVDRPLAKDLVRILQQANQPVPAFLESEAAISTYTECGGDEFAGTDIRTANSNVPTVPSPSGVEEENWD